MAKAAPKRTGKKTSTKTTRRTTAARKPSNLTVWQGIVTRAWKEPAFRERLVQDPGGVLTEHGFKAKKGVRYQVVADSKDTKHLILPESARSIRVKQLKGNEPDPGF